MLAWAQTLVEAGPTLPPLSWSDLGTTRRVLEILHRARLTPPWLASTPEVA